MTKPKNRKDKPKFRNVWQIQGVRSQLTAAINSCTDGAYVMLDIKSARNLIEICLQAEHTEAGHLEVAHDSV